MTIDTIPEALLVDCVQLVKANSIQGLCVCLSTFIKLHTEHCIIIMQIYILLLGSKTNNIQVVYTLYGNLKKTQGMDVGQVGFHSDKEVQDNILIVISLNGAMETGTDSKSGEKD